MSCGETAGGWTNGLQQMRSVAGNPHNESPTAWYSHHSDSTIGASLQEAEKERQRSIAVDQQQQERHRQPTADSMSLWGAIHSVLAKVDADVADVLCRHGPENHTSQIMRPDLVYSDRIGEQQHKAVQKQLGI